MFDNDLKLLPFLLSVSCHVKNLDFFIRSRVALDVLQSASNVKITSRIARHTILAAVSPVLTFASEANCINEFFREACRPCQLPNTTSFSCSYRVIKSKPVYLDKYEKISLFTRLLLFFFWRLVAHSKASLLFMPTFSSCNGSTYRMREPAWTAKEQLH